MVLSMTGYGKSEAFFDNRKYTVEIRSLNGKTCDISLKTSVIPREKEFEVRKYIAEKLVRGNIDLFITSEIDSGCECRKINEAVLKSYSNQVKSIFSSQALSPDVNAYMAASLLRMPDVLDVGKDEVSPECWDVIYEAIRQAVDALIAFRMKEGAVLREDVGHRAELISSWVDEIEKYEKERIDAVRERILARMAELKLEPDLNRLEQEIIFYIEKLDINEEKVRLRQHCRYFAQTMESEAYPGKKLGFIAQEMGREINTTGSKANHAEIQKWVVRMKDELEKIKEQSLNIL
ncbi:MAG: YicC family protein [Alistipes sp.]|nr:YicC family protein [Candidatus Minthomonas equi]